MLPLSGKPISSTGATNAELPQIRNALRSKTVVCADTRGPRMMDANGGHLTPRAAARQPLTPSRDIILNGVTSAEGLLTRTAERTLNAVSAVGLGPSGTVLSGNPRMPSVDASTTSLNSNHISSVGATSATNLLIKIVARAPTAVSAVGLGPRMTAPGGTRRTLPADARTWSATTRTISLTGVISAIKSQTRIADIARKAAASAVGRGPNGTLKSGSHMSLVADAGTKLAI